MPPPSVHAPTGTNNNQVAAVEQDEFVSDFSDDDCTAEESLLTQAISLVEELQPWINQTREFQFLLSSHKTKTLFELHRVLDSFKFQHELRSLVFVFGHLQNLDQVPSLMQTKPISYWQDQIRSAAFNHKTMSASEIYSKILCKPMVKDYYKACLNQQIQKHESLLS